MKKEVLIAILIGLGMGLIITYGFYRVQLGLSNPQNVTEITDLASPTPTQAPEVLAVHSPEDGLVQTETEITITGTTIPNTFVVIFVNEDDFITTADDTGNFSYTTELSTGANVIVINVVDEGGKTYSAERVVVVSDVFEEDETTETATDSAETTTNNEN